MDGLTNDSVPGEENLPKTLGGPTPEEEKQGVEPETPPAPGENPEPATEARNKGSEGNKAEVAVDKGKDLFSTGENQHTLVFGDRKPDPFDKRALKRLISRPFSESLPKKRKALVNEINDPIEQHINEAIDKTIQIDEEFMKEINKLSKSNFNKKINDDNE